jgi:hypothetical protein
VTSNLPLSLECVHFGNKSETPTRRELSWGKAIWGPTSGLTDEPTNRRTDRQTKSLIEALARAKKIELLQCKFGVDVDFGCHVGWRPSCRRQEKSVAKDGQWSWTS